jgi:hypothetical protein
MAGEFPTKDDVALWDKYDATYGMDEAGQLQRGAQGPSMPMDDMFLLERAYSMSPTQGGRAEARKKLEATIKNTPMDEARREMLMRNFIASHKSGVASLGFDPSKIVQSTESKNINPLDNMLGYTLKDYMYAKRDPRDYGATITHENMHKGIQTLLDNKEASGTDSAALDKVDPYASRKGFDDNELAVRALMQKHYGDVERKGQLVAPTKQFEGGTRFLMENPDILDELEQLASDELKRRGRPMGPR